MIFHSTENLPGSVNVKEIEIAMNRIGMDNKPNSLASGRTTTLEVLTIMNAEIISIANKSATILVISPRIRNSPPITSRRPLLAEPTL